MDNYSDEELRQFAYDHGIDPDQHCCLKMAARIGLVRAVAPQVPVLTWLAAHDEYRIGVGAQAPDNPPEWRWERVVISYCPWCGTKLPPSRHREWYDELVRRGFTDPGNDPIPDEFKSDAWWRE